MIYLLIAAGSFITFPVEIPYEPTVSFDYADGSVSHIAITTHEYVEPIDVYDLGLAPQTDWAAEFAESHITEQDYATQLRVRFAPYLDR